MGMRKPTKIQRTDTENVKPRKKKGIRKHMTIIEAVKGVTAEKPYIYRRLWCFPAQEPHDGTMLVEPLNTVGGSKIATLLKGTGVSAFGAWNPAAEDLTVDDWELYADAERNVLLEALGEVCKPGAFMPPFGRKSGEAAT